MTTQREESALTEAKAKGTKGKKKTAGAAGSAGKTPAKAKGEPKPKAAKKSPKAAKTPRSAKMGKGDQIVELLQRTGGATMEELQKASGWQAHSVRGFLSGTVKKKMGLNVFSAPLKDGGRTYMIAQ